MKPSTKPQSPLFSSGPCAKRPGWQLSNLNNAPLGRSHRSSICKGKLKNVIDKSKSILGIPKDYLLGIVPASDTGAVEMAMWNLLGYIGVDILAWESFGSGWANNAKNQLKVENLNIITADYGKLPDLSAVNFNHDVVFTWNGTTSGVKVPDATWINDKRKGLAICDATSAVFAMDIAWSKLDVITWSWQKSLGGEAAHGMIALSPRAVERLETYQPKWPIPKIFTLAKKGKLIEGIFSGATINTPSMLCVEDALDSLNWAESIGGLPNLINRSEDNLQEVKDWVKKSPWIDFLAEDEDTISNSSICLKISDPTYLNLSNDKQNTIIKSITKILEKEEVAFDIGAYRDAPAGLRIWGGPTVEQSDIQSLLPWLEWSFEQAISSNLQAA